MQSLVGICIFVIMRETSREDGTVYPCSSVSIDKRVKDPNFLRSSSLLIFWGKKFGYEILRLGGSFLNSAILDLYLETRSTLLVPSKHFKSRITYLISICLFYITVSCFSIEALCLASMPSISNCFFCKKVLISLCKTSPCLYRSAVGECFSWLLVFMMAAGSWYLGKIDFSSSSKSLLKTFTLKIFLNIHLFVTNMFPRGNAGSSDRSVAFFTVELTLFGGVGRTNKRFTC